MEMKQFHSCHLCGAKFDTSEQHTCGPEEQRMMNLANEHRDLTKHFVAVNPKGAACVECKWEAGESIEWINRICPCGKVIPIQKVSHD